MTKSELVHKIESNIPEYFLKIYRDSKRYLRWKRQQLVYKKTLRSIIQKNEPIKVVFIVHNSAIWKYDSLYRLMQTDANFNPIILVCPIVVGQTESSAREILQRTYNTFYSRGYNVLNALEQGDMNILNPDIVFYTYQWTTIIDKQYDIHNLRKYLKCYVNYGFNNTAGEWGFASAFHGLMWRYFAECEDVRQSALNVQPREMRNMVVTGYPIYDEYQSVDENVSIWKNSDRRYKRVIWAPHHTISGHDGLLKFSTFLENAELMLSLANEYKDTIQFTFKPHPSLKGVLYNHPDWGVEKTDAYYNSWANAKNATFVDGAYMDLFKSSDAMIHDCGSFIVEYLYSKKPVMYLGNNREEQSNIVGKKAYQCHYHGTTIEDVKLFLQDVVLKGLDPMKCQRENFFNEVLLPPNDMTVAENMLNVIKDELHR